MKTRSKPLPPHVAHMLTLPQEEAFQLLHKEVNKNKQLLAHPDIIGWCVNNKEVFLTAKYPDPPPPRTLLSKEGCENISTYINARVDMAHAYHHPEVAALKGAQSLADEYYQKLPPDLRAVIHHPNQTTDQ
jgi:hypothetical protein